MHARLALMNGLLTVAAVLLSGGLWAQGTSSLAIVDEPLPALDAGVEVKIPLHARGGVPPYHWRIDTGVVPEGIILTDEGVLIGRPTQPGNFDFTVTVEDSARPPSRVSKPLQTRVTASLLFDWQIPAQVRGRSIEGSVKVSNGTKDDFDLTVLVVAVNENGRATALGYQHFTLKAGVMYFVIPFGSNLPSGTYQVHGDAVAEIPSKTTILRKQLDAPVPLPVTQGP